jgi:hypothetical protein
MNVQKLRCQNCGTILSAPDPLPEPEFRQLAGEHLRAMGGKKGHPKDAVLSRVGSRFDTGGR